ncbi:hypothetical protein QYE76_029637 [Lolium multiflorum]|uniref:UBN2_3 domain-containing protein n=1 Tax=Lolium multiflorum TaxID=4521 RepID=A0AAD8QPY7_LOLMU|nr:hypothetical protein QYE76_029637 [Lolium multiflorum]
MPPPSFEASTSHGGLGPDPYAYGGAPFLGFGPAPGAAHGAVPPGLGPLYGAAPTAPLAVVPSPAAYAMASSPAGGVAPFYIAHLIPMKLSPDNYLAWRAQDQAILSGIQSSLIESVSWLVLFATTSREAWDALDTSYSTQSIARSMAIRTQLGELKKNNLSVTLYFNKISALADTLASIGQPLRPEEFISYVVNGLDDDYDSLVENATGRTTPIQPQELYARMLATEQRMAIRRSSPSYAAANVATH